MERDNPCTHFYRRRGHPHRRRRGGCPRGEPPSPSGWAAPASGSASLHPSSVPPPAGRQLSPASSPQAVSQPPARPQCCPHLILPALRVTHGPEVEVGVTVVVAVHAHQSRHPYGTSEAQVGCGGQDQSLQPTCPQTTPSPCCYPGTCGPASSQ